MKSHFLNRSCLAPFLDKIRLKTVDNILFKNVVPHHRASKRDSFSHLNLQIFLQECNLAVCKNLGHKGEVYPNKDEIKKRKAEGRLYCYFCEQHGYKHPDCPELRLWEMKTGGKQEMEHLLMLGSISPFSINF